MSANFVEALGRFQNGGQMRIVQSTEGLELCCAIDVIHDDPEAGLVGITLAWVAYKEETRWITERSEGF